MLDGIIQGIIQNVLGWALKYPLVSTILMVIGVLRVVMKPFMSFLHTVTAATPGTGDDQLLDQVEASKVYQTFLYVLDWLGSIKTSARMALEKK